MIVLRTILLVVLSSALAVGLTIFFMRGGAAKLPTINTGGKIVTGNMELEERTVNLADSSGSHYLKVSLAVQIVGKGKLEEVVEKCKPQLMDALIDVVGQMTYAELLKPEGKVALKKHLQERFSEALKEEGWEAKSVLFTDLVME
jgi:flagellar FliL protein